MGKSEAHKAQRRYDQAVKELKKLKYKYEAGGLDWVKKDHPKVWNRYILIQMNILKEKGFIELEKYRT